MSDKYIIRPARQTGGKAGKGLNKSSTIQVIEKHDGYSLMLKHFRYTVGDHASKQAAYRKAFNFVRELDEQKAVQS